MATWERYMGNIYDVLVEECVEDTGEVDSLWVLIQTQSKEILRLKERLAQYGISDNE